MKTLCHKKTDESLHVFSDSTEIYISNGSLWFKYKEKPDFEIKGFDEEHFLIYENVEVPSYWVSRNFKYNPKYGWKLNNNYNYKEEEYEWYLKDFLIMCFVLKNKKILTDEEYNNLTDFSEIKNLIYHPLSYYMRK